MTISINGSLRVLGALCGGLGIAGCGALPEGPTESGDALGTASIALTQVPSPVQCVRVVATGSTTVTTNLSVTVGSSSASLNIGRLPLGPTQFSASAFDLPCSGVGTALPSWVADPVSTTLRAGVPANVALTFRTDSSVTVNANFVQSATELVPFRFSVHANALVMADSTLRTTGFAAGLLTSTTFSNPGVTDVLTAAAGDWHICVITKSTGAVSCAGTNTFGQLGPGVPVGGFSNTLVPVPLPTRASRLAAGREFTCAVAEASQFNLSELYCWGNNSRGQLGSASAGAMSATPVQVTGITGNENVYAGDEFACAVDGGVVNCWGANSFGQLGDGTTTDSPTATGVLGAVAPVSLALGTNHACSLSGAGGVKCWGDNSSGQLGNGTFVSSSLPVDVVGLGSGSNVVQLSAGRTGTYARFANGTVSVWGEGYYGELGLGDGLKHTTPAPLTSVQDVAQIASSDITTLVLLSDRNVLGWGYNGNFNIGDGTRATRAVPTKCLMQ